MMAVALHDAHVRAFLSAHAKDAARRLSSGVRREGFKPEALHPYTDALGQPLLWRARLRHPDGRKWIRPIRRNGARFELGEPQFPNGKPLYRLDELITRPDEPVFVVEGEWCADHIAKYGLLATTSGGADSAEKADWTPLSTRADVRVWPDHDSAGQKYGATVCEQLRALRVAVRVLDVDSLGLPSKGDCVDWLAAHPHATATEMLALALSPGSDEGQAEDASTWPEPLPLPCDLPPVPAFPSELLPDALRPWVSDIAERIQCPPEFVAVPMMVALASVIGRRICIRPQHRTDWTEAANLWGCIVGRPGAMKSPALSAALAPIERLAARARAEHAEREATDHARATEAALRAKLAEQEARKRLRQDRHADVAHLLAVPEDIATPPARRYNTHDSSYQALAELLMQNPNGLMVVRDELVSLLDALDAEDNAEARGFYLTGWNGSAGYIVDRIGRGLGRHVDAVCLSLIGGTQPGRLAAYVRAANRGGAGDDGLLQRFGLLVWPDGVGEWRDVDRWPDSTAKRRTFDVFDRLDALTPEAAGAERDIDHSGEPTGQPFLRFDPGALEAFAEWRSELESTIRAGQLSPALESHFAKYRKLVPSLALVCHLADGGYGPVTLASTLRAIGWAQYLAPHARRVYGSEPTRARQAARAILAKVQAGVLSSPFTARDIYRNQWAGLGEREAVRDALDLLTDFGHVVADVIQTGGRTTTAYIAHPRYVGVAS